MRINRATDMGLRTLLVLDRLDGQRITLADLADRMDLPQRHLGNVVQRLAREGWVATSRGRGGGIEITEGGRHAAAAQVFTAFEGTGPVVNCEDPPCPLLDQGCRLRRALLAAQAAFLEVLDESSVTDLAQHV